MKLYHGSYDKLTDLIVREGTMFNGMFFSDDMDDAFGPGAAPRFFYSTEIRDDEIAEVHELAYEDASADAARKLWGDDAGVMLDLVCDEIAPWDADDEQQAVLSRRFRCSDMQDPDLSWEMQRQASLLAGEMGYKAVAVSDEHGKSYIVLPGAQMELVREGK